MTDKDIDMKRTICASLSAETVAELDRAVYEAKMSGDATATRSRLIDQLITKTGNEASIIKGTRMWVEVPADLLTVLRTSYRDEDLPGIIQVSMHRHLLVDTNMEQGYDERA